ncbi:MAG: SRPBCC family protein [Actinomycetota bacterium]
MEFTNTVTIHRSRSEVFAFLSDLENVPKWNYAIVETRKLSEGPPVAGAMYRQVRSLPARSEETVELAELMPEERLVIRGDLGPFTGDLVYELDEVEGGTRLTNTAHLQGRGAVRIAEALARGRVRDAVAANLGALKDLLEAPAGRR